jgi:hypothetical protein
MHKAVQRPQDNTLLYICQRQSKMADQALT